MKLQSAAPQVEEDFAGRSPHTPGASGRRSSAAGGRRRGMDSGQDDGRALVRTLSMAEAAGRTMGKMHVGLPTLAEQQPAAKGASPTPCAKPTACLPCCSPRGSQLVQTARGF